MAMLYDIPYATTIAAARAAAEGIRSLIEKHDISVKSLQDYHKVYRI